MGTESGNGFGAGASGARPCWFFYRLTPDSDRAQFDKAVVVSEKSENGGGYSIERCSRLNVIREIIGSK